MPKPETLPPKTPDEPVEMDASVEVQRTPAPGDSGTDAVPGDVGKPSDSSGIPEHQARKVS
jgi:hypothetical protein